MVIFHKIFKTHRHICSPDVKCKHTVTSNSTIEYKRVIKLVLLHGIVCGGSFGV